MVDFSKASGSTGISFGGSQSAGVDFSIGQGKERSAGISFAGAGGQTALDKIGGFALSAVESFPELFGIETTEQTQTYRARNPVSGFLSQAAGAFVPYVGAAKLARSVPLVSRGIAGLESLGGTSTIAKGALGAVGEAAAVEAARLALTATPLPELLYESATGRQAEIKPFEQELGNAGFNIAGSGVLGGVIGGVMGRFAKGPKIQDIVPDAAPDAPLVKQVRALNDLLAKDADPADPFNFPDESTRARIARERDKRLKYNLQDVVPRFTDTGEAELSGLYGMDQGRAYRALEGEVPDKQGNMKVSNFFNRIWKQTNTRVDNLTESKRFVYDPLDPATGFGSEDELASTLEALGMSREELGLFGQNVRLFRVKEGSGKRPQDSSLGVDPDRELAQGPRAYSKSTADKRAENVGKIFNSPLLQDVGNGWKMAKEKGTGFFTMVKQVKGTPTSLIEGQKQAVADDITAMMVGAKRGKREARAIGKLWAERIATKAEQRGISIEDAWRDEGLSIKFGKRPEFLRNKEFNQFIGINANLGDEGTSKLLEAFRLADNGLSNEKVRLETGWFRSDDGLWRYEIPDSQAPLKQEGFTAGDGLDDSLIASGWTGDILDAEAAFAAYPRLRDIPIELRSDIPPGSGAYHPSTRSIKISSYTSPEETKSIVLHELQHAIQHIENQNWGSNPNHAVRAEPHTYSREVRKRIDDVKKYDTSLAKKSDDEILSGVHGQAIRQRAAYETYKKSAGEIEARLVQRRANLTPEERAKISPLDEGPTSRDVPFGEGSARTKFEDTYPNPAAGGGGMVDIESKVISLFRDADAATALHESAHLWLSDVLELADDALPQAVKDREAVVRWLLGATDDRPLALSNEGVQSILADRNMQEKFANGFVEWLKQGDSSVPQLNKIFTQFKNWLVKLFSTAQENNLPINADVRAAFGNLFKNELRSARAGDEYVILRTDRPEAFAPRAAAQNEIVMKASYFPQPEEAARKIGVSLWDIGQDYIARYGQDLVDAKRKTATGPIGAMVRDSADTLRVYGAPTQPGGTANPKLNLALQHMKNLEFAVDAQVDAVMRGTRELLKTTPFKNIITLESPVTNNGLQDYVMKIMTKAEREEFLDILNTEVPYEKVQELHSRGVVSDGAFNLLTALQTLSDDWSNQVARIAVEVKSGEGVKLVSNFQTRRGHYMLSHEFPGGYSVSLEDAAGNYIGRATGASPKEARDAAEAVIGEQAKKGKDVFAGGMIDHSKMSEEEFLRLTSTARRPGFLKSRSEQIGYELGRGNISADDLSRIIERNIKRRYEFLRDVTVFEQTEEIAAQLSRESPNDFKFLSDRLMRMQKNEGSFAQAQNRMMDKTLHAVGFSGKDSASAIVQALQKTLTSFQFGFGAITQPVQNILGTLQTILPQIAYALHADADTLARNYVTLPLLNGKNEVAGSMGLLSEVKLFKNALARLAQPWDQLPEDYRLLHREMIRRRVLDPRFSEEQFGTNGELLRDPLNAFKDSRSFVRFVGAANDLMMSKSEQLNRMIAMNAAYEIGRLRNMDLDHLMHFTQEFMGKTAFNYGTVDRASVFTTPLGSLGGTFKNWMFHYLGTMLQFADGGKGALPALAWQTAATAAIGGATATPFVLPIADGASKWLTDKSFMQNVYDATDSLGGDERVADGLMYGLPGALGVSFASQVASPGSDPKRDAQMIFSFAAFDRMKALSTGVKEALTAYRTTGESPFEDEQVRDQLSRALAPRTLYRMMAVTQDTAIKSLGTGYDVTHPMGLGGALMYATGFNPTELEKTYEVYNAIRDNQQAQRKLTTEMGQTVAQAWEQEDDRLATRTFVRANALGIDTSAVLRSAQARMKRKQQTQLDFAASPQDQANFEFMFDDDVE